MATIFPDSPVGTTTLEVMKVYGLLKRLPDEAYKVWQRLAFPSEEGPDFWVLYREERVLLLKVSPATPKAVEAAVQPTLFSEAEAPLPGEREREILLRFRDEAQPAGTAPLPLAVLFPNVALPVLKQALPADMGPDLYVAGKETMSPDGLEAWIDQHLSPPLAKEAIDALRGVFAPEVRVPPALTVRSPNGRQSSSGIDRHTEAGLTGFLLDYNQEQALKADLALSAEARRAAREFGVRLVNGVAGSGKSLIIIYRAHLLRQLFPRKRILVLTHNRALIRDLEARYQALSGGDYRVEWRTFLSWCRRRWPREEEPPEVIPNWKRKQLLTRVWHAHLADTAVSPRMLGEEIDWVKDRLLFDRNAYLNADRSGRGFGLGESMRERLFEALVAYQQSLREEGFLDWPDLPRRLWQWADEGRLQWPTYDVVLVDEAQFFAPIWFEIIKRIVRPRSGHLFLAADPSQGFLKRRQSWLASGIDVRGRAQRLEKSYRTTHAILNFATLLYRQRLPDDDEDIVAPDLLNMPQGAVPVVIPLSSPQDESTRVVNEIRQLLQSGVPRRDILLIHADWRETGRLLRRLQASFGVDAAVDPGEASGGDQIRVTSLNGATGLESPIVFLMGVHALYEEEQSVRLSEEERTELIRDNTRRLYMAATRAGQRLVVTYVGQIPAILSELAQQQTVELEGGLFRSAV